MPPAVASAGTVLAFDFGEKRVGVASGELALGLAHPLATIGVVDRERRFDAIASVIAEWQPVWLVVGLPTREDGTPHEMTARARRFARELQRRFSLPVVLVDERLSTRAASQALREAGLRARKHKPVRDQVAAQVILQSFFDDKTLPDAESVYAELESQLKRGLDYHACLVGIHSGGAWLAERLAQALPGEHPVGFLDVSFYRDDYGQRGLKSRLQRSNIPFDVADKRILLVDDVLYTGRSVRAALNELFDYGRPASVELAVLIDRGGRELPVEAQYVGACLACVREQQIVLTRDEAGRFVLALEPAGPGDATAYA